LLGIWSRRYVTRVERNLKIEILKRRASTPSLKAYFWAKQLSTILPGPIFFFLCESSVFPVCDFGHLQEASGERLTLRVTQDVPFVCRESLYFLWGKSVFFYVGNTLTKLWFICGEASHVVYFGISMGISRRPSGGGVRECGVRLFRRGKTITEAKLDEIAEIFNVQLLHQAAAVGISIVLTEMPGNRAIEGYRNLLAHECERCTPTGCKRVAFIARR
jgi:hypothetical protein